ncbi:GDP-mannose pyrophosphatase NudK [Pedobacter sp. MR2016-19]|uniref:GDP-mannose pyrophosphatase NudK n=1 Tax=Pedobacter sp. MR2016-19 TaxID=2780089 RepID=UPI0018766B9E|nr:GDP-mannose pyrophosphatase NudK [Pedobacter sp. MR2016-19]MBE5318542.1 GDP-mannose pyrophosphatase NudK [Pedobacter sp. MR2016-19]
MKNINILNTQILSDNWYTLKKVTFEMSGMDGAKSVLERETYDRGNGATILLYNKEAKTVVLTRQFRMPTFINGNDTGYLIECCAGLLDQDNAEDCIKRETEEETGFRIDKVEKVFEAYMSPGSVTELLYFFVAAYSNEMKLHDGGGLQEENEDIEVLEIPFEKALEMMKSGEIKDGKTIMLLQYAQLNELMR